ncbi:hypothetical protein HMPREF1991_01976 [Hoylesella loescheii DSM 19665 = JCM 12249 = ATCC 15930]|uniref:Uncharacterized protein n=1 Tax=Hoylesella loescheii DSM 19665 = JCM 12249 = ATCC 15930 TaxID=1122985 RepID=A0A069QPZ2_HOYLO|nr:hypothetical protein HMPREF1991_01976 [Hoylesella loescheii DSM 19665 = JCM 12249 = ATCC 15930]
MRFLHIFAAFHQGKPPQNASEFLRMVVFSDRSTKIQCCALSTR